MSRNVMSARGGVVRDYNMGEVVRVQDSNLARAGAAVVVVQTENNQYIWRHGTGARLTRGECALLRSRLAADPTLCMSSLVIKYAPSNGN